MDVSCNSHHWKTRQCLRVEDPVLSVAVGLVGLLGSLVPRILNLGEEAVLVLLRALLDLLASGGQVVGELRGTPVVVGLGDVVLPVLADEITQVLAVGRGGVGDVVVGEPALKLSLMPLVVSCTASPSVRTCLKRWCCWATAQRRRIRCGSTFAYTSSAAMARRDTYRLCQRASPR